MFKEMQWLAVVVMAGLISAVSSVKATQGENTLTRIISEGGAGSFVAPLDIAKGMELRVGFGLKINLDIQIDGPVSRFSQLTSSAGRLTGNEKMTLEAGEYRLIESYEVIAFSQISYFKGYDLRAREEIEREVTISAKGAYELRVDVRLIDAAATISGGFEGELTSFSEPLELTLTAVEDFDQGDVIEFKGEYKVVLQSKTALAWLEPPKPPEPELAVEVDGDWDLVINRTDLKGGPGSDLNNVYKSDPKQVLMHITGAKGCRWEVDVWKEDNEWLPQLALYVRTTSKELKIANNAQRFFSGKATKKNIELQFKLKGVSVEIPPGVYSTTIYYTVKEE